MTILATGSHVTGSALAADLLMYVAEEHPHEFAHVFTALLLEFMKVGVIPDDASAERFVSALNGSLAEIAIRHGAPRAWRLVPYDTRRH